MCTLTYLPTPKGYLLTSSRDESTQRASAIFPVYKQIGNTTTLMPQDPLGGGSWIATDYNGNTACLLNGALENHQRQLPYRRSRGLVLLDSFLFSEIEKFVGKYSFEGIEPFTLICFRQKGKSALHQIQWDAKQVYHQELSVSQPHIWSSVTLYDHVMRQKRFLWFQHWLAKQPDFTTENIMHFHLYGGEGNPEIDFKMIRGSILQTISLSCVEVKPEITRFIYQDFILNTTAEEVLCHSAHQTT